MRNFILALVCLVAVSHANAHKRYTTKHYHRKHAKGLKRHHDAHLKFKERVSKISYVDMDVAVPRTADISKLVSLPEDQGDCGSCWDFSLTKALRSTLMVDLKDPGKLEFNYLLNNCGPGTAEYGCNGGDFPAADNFLKGYGPGLDAHNPYTQHRGSCKHLPVAATALSYHMLGGTHGPTFKDLAVAIAVNKHMVSVDVAAGSGDWEHYSDGVYNGCTGSAKDIDHMIDAVGYDCETSVDASGNCVFKSDGSTKNGDGLLLVQNNWSEIWGVKAANGHGGYMWTTFSQGGHKCNAIATDALEFTVTKSPPMPPVPPTPPAPPAPPEPVVCHGFMCQVLPWLPWCDCQ